MSVNEALVHAFIPCSQDIGVLDKTGVAYRYIIGICVDVGDLAEKHRDCGIMQYGANISHCLGRVTNMQISQSKGDFILLLTFLFTFIPGHRQR